VADDAVRDEVAGSGRDVVHRHLDVERLDGDNTQPRPTLERETFDRPFARDRGIDRVEEAKAFLKPSGEADRNDSVCSLGISNTDKAIVDQLTSSTSRRFAGPACYLEDGGIATDEFAFHEAVGDQGGKEVPTPFQSRA
jgi:hypothetical protein